MTDSLKFGPEWLRNMKPENATNNITTTVTTAIKMAEFRYGREEMLALFDRTVLAPDPLKQIQGLHVEKTQPPLALLQMTDEETRMWNRGINSDAVLRLTTNKPGGSGSGGPGAPGGGMRGGSVLGGRGGSVDRGRGRARGTYHYSRGLSYEDSEGFNSGGSYSRNIRNFDRTQSQGANQWTERNGGGLGVDHGDWSSGNMSTSPRKEYLGRSMSDTNWRRHRGSGEEEEGWRSTKHEKWTRGTSWRDGDSNWETNRGSSGPTRSWEETSAPPSSRKPWEPEENSLPEWATENPSDSGGSFDATGAFHGGGVYSDEDEDVHHTSGPTRGETGRGNHTTTNHKSSPPGNKEAPPNIVNGTSQMERIVDRDRNSKSNSSGLRQSQSASSLSSSSTVPTERKTSVPARSSTSVNLSVLNTKTKPCEKLKEEEKSAEPLAPVPKVKIQPSLKQKQFRQSEPAQPTVAPSSNERSEEAMLRMQEAANDLVAKLMEDEERDLPKQTAPTVQQSVSQNSGTVPSDTEETDRWYYRDPQGIVQGPFFSAEMAEWFKSGYFTLNLQLRRECDEIYSPLGDLIALFGHIPFLVNSSIPPIKANDNLSTLPTIPTPAAPQPQPPPPPPKPIDETLLLQQQYQYQQRQMILSQQQALFKQLTQSERFNSLTPLEQQQVLVQQTANLDLGLLSGYIPTPPMPQPAPVPTPPQSLTNTQNSVIAMIQQLHQQQQQQAQVAAASIVPTEPAHNPLAPQSIDPVQLIQQIGGLQAQPSLLPQPQMHPKQLEDQRCIEQLLNLFANVRKTSPINAQPPPRPQTVKQIESVWGGTGNAGPNYSPNWPLPPAPPGQLPPSLWGELHTKGMKTEQEILEEQLRVEEERKKEERRKQEELQRLKEEMEEKERARQRREEEEAVERKRKEDEERERRRLKEEEERKKQEAAAKKAEQERLRKEEEKKRKEEEKKRKEDLKRKQEEEKRKQEEERKKQEEEKKKKEEENKRAEEVKRQAEALKRLQEQHQQAQVRAAVKPSTTPAWTATDSTTTSTSLSDIQKTERKQQLQYREQQQLLQLIQQHQQQERNISNKSGSSLNLKWAETKKPPARVKSLAEIQAEEQEQLAKQTEREKAERMAQAKEVPLPATSSIWANQNLTWNSQNSGSVWGGSAATGGSSSGPGFWEEVAPPTPAPKPTSKNKPSISGGSSNAANKSATIKNRAKKDEMTVLKLFEQKPKCDEFSNWCTKILSSMHSTVDIPTFVQFLREIEPSYEVKEYVRMYLGEGKEAMDFASQFIERRSRAKSGEPQKRTDNMTAASTNHFQEVKGKNKKIKKGKMLRVDNRILGFSVTASQDRFNVGDRDYGENI